jgi:Spy/CpxP family protein refolding chaperone
MQTMMRLLAASIVPLALLGIPLAGAAWGEAPYGGLEKRTLKALSEQQIADLRAGRGMSLALAAELNGYPGPTHVLENAQALELTPRQQDLTKSLLQAMKEEAIPLGLRLIEQEATLDDLFASKEITPSKLVSETEAIALTQARLRQTHLKYHLSMMKVLSPEQISRYQELRGYSPRQWISPHQHKHN